MASARATLGVDVGGTATKAAIVAPDGQVLLRVERPTEHNAGTKGIIAVSEELLRRSAELGVTVEAVRARVGLPVVVDNDANAAAWGERTFGAARGSDHVAYITVGTGIGSGFVVEGRLLRGFSGAGAELGHTVIDPSGPRCGCGLRGCLEQFASGIGIARLARAALGEDPDTSILAFAGSVETVTAEDVSRAAHQYDQTARHVLERAGAALGLGLSNVANIFDPEVIVMTGSVVRAGEPFLGPVRDELHRMTSAQRRRPLRLDLSTLEGDAGLIGAARLAWEEIDPTARDRDRVTP